MTYWTGSGMGPTDERLLADLNDYLVVQFPAYSWALVYHVKQVRNKGREDFMYGEFPTKTSTGVNGYDGSGTTIPADGTIAEREYTTDGVQFPLLASLQQGADDNNNMFYLSVETGHRKMLYQTLIKVIPEFVRVDVQTPPGVRPFEFQGDIPGGVDKDIGYSRGYLNLVWIPELRNSVRIGNDTNLQLRLSAYIKYRELVVELETDPEIIFQILAGIYPYPRQVKRVTMPQAIQAAQVETAIKRAYGIDKGFKYHPPSHREEAKEEYAPIIASINRHNMRVGA